jgi:hypothetical protein
MVAGPTAPFLAHFLHAWDNLTWGFLWGYSIWSAYISSSAHANEVLAFLLRIFKFEVLAFLPVLMQMNSSNWQCTQIFYKVLYFKVCQWHFCVHSYICVDHWLGVGHSQRFEAKPAKKNPSHLARMTRKFANGSASHRPFNGSMPHPNPNPAFLFLLTLLIRFKFVPLNPIHPSP